MIGTCNNVVTITPRHSIVILRMLALSIIVGDCTSYFCYSAIADPVAQTLGWGTAQKPTGLMGGAPRRRNRDGVHDHDLLLVGLKVRRADATQGGVVLTTYRVLGLDRVQHYAFIACEEGTDVEKRVGLVPTKRRPTHVLLTVRGEWQLLPNQASVVPYSRDAMVCARCWAQSSRPPCVSCYGAQDGFHGLIIGGELRGR